MQVSAPKSVAAYRLKNLSSLGRSEMVIFYSSIASLLGSPGQTVYSAANQVLDAYASWMQNCGELSVSVQWGAWASAGMATKDKSTANRLQRMGIGSLRINEGLRAFEAVLCLQKPLIAAVPFDWSRFGNASHEIALFVENMKESTDHKVEVRMEGGIATKSALDLMAVTSLIDSAVTDILGAGIGHSEPFMASGLDSLGAVELRNALEKSLQIQLPSTIVFDYPTISTMSQYIVSLSGDGIAGSHMAMNPVVSNEMADSVSVVYSSNVSPLSGLDFKGEVDSINLVPFTRWDLEAIGGLEARFGSYLSDISGFDAAAFSMSTTEAVLVDPQQRLLLCLVGDSIISYKSTANSSCGVFVGLASSDYGSLVHQFADKGAFHATSNALSVACGRISYTFGFQGPSVSIDTACSASLVAAHLAAKNIADGTIPLSHVSGVHLQCTPTSTSYVWAASMLSPSGRCKALDSSADGYVRGEMCACLVLEGGSHREHAMEGVILSGSAVNQDGRSSSLTAPNGPSQTNVIISALTQAGIPAESISGLSMHGTGTALGDPIEAGAALAAYGKHLQSDGFRFMASKSWVGHGEPAAGMAGLLLAERSLAQENNVQLIHLRSVNHHVSSNIGSRRLYLPREQGPKPTQTERLFLGVSAFAFSGTNAHAILVRESSYTFPRKPVLWEERRLYVVPEMHLLLNRFVSLSHGSIRLHSIVQRANCFYMWDHQVLNKSIFPGK